MKKLRPRLTFANVTSMLALFVALGGSAYAASHLGKNSVGSKQLKNNAVATAKIKKEAVTGAKVKKGTLTGKNINLTTLGTVPSASQATVANGLSPLEATHLVGASGQPGFEGGSENEPGAGPFHFNPVGFYKDHEGIVHLQGVAKVGPEGTVFRLPSGFRPASGVAILLEQVNNAPVQIFGSNISSGPINVDGQVRGNSGKAADLDAITYRAES